tara:strand:+ start:1040 stop:1204 length:165 start_codon:yes stop_codon:yes gene_type:complete
MVKGSKKTMSRYRVRYTSKSGKKISKIVVARTGDNAFLHVKRTLGGRNIMVKKA